MLFFFLFLLYDPSSRRRRSWSVLVLEWIDDEEKEKSCWCQPECRIEEIKLLLVIISFQKV